MQRPIPPRFSFLELSLDDRCNLRCLGCRSCSGEGASMSPQEALSLLRWGRTRGAHKLWLGGGEPLLRPDVLGLCKAARALGYGEVHVQTNALRLGYEAFTDALLQAGATHLRINLKSHDEAVHDALCREPGSHALLEKALAVLKSKPAPLTGDVLLTTHTVPSLARTVEHYRARGVAAFSLWLLSAADSDDAEVRDAIPTLTSVAAALAEASEVAARLGATIESLHTPPCTLAPSLRPLFRPASSWDLTVADARGPFRLDDSPFEGGVFVEGCARCSMRRGCTGARRDYLDRHGEGEFVPIEGA